MSLPQRRLTTVRGTSVRMRCKACLGCGYDPPGIVDVLAREAEHGDRMGAWRARWVVVSAAPSDRLVRLIEEMVIAGGLTCPAKQVPCRG